MNEQTDLIQYTKKRSLCRRLLPLRRRSRNLSRYYSDVLTIAHDYIITADYKLLPATEAIGEDYESGYIAYPPDVMEKLLALDGY